MNPWKRHVRRASLVGLVLLLCPLLARSEPAESAQVTIDRFHGALLKVMQQAEELDPGGQLVVESLLDMGRVHQAQGHPDTAATFQARARALQSRSRQ